MVRVWVRELELDQVLAEVLELVLQELLLQVHYIPIVNCYRYCHLTNYYSQQRYSLLLLLPP